jgi:hypothetical protein
MARWRRRRGGAEPRDEEWGRGAEEVRPFEVETGENLRPVYIILGLTVIVAFVIVLLFPDHFLVEQFGANVATEGAAILVTLIFVHRFLDHQDRARRLRASVGALRRASRGIERLARAWVLIVKGTLPRRDASRPRTLRALLTPELTEGLAYADPDAQREDESGRQPWLLWAAREIDAAQAHLHDIVVAYGASLDPAYVEAVDDLIDDPFVHLFHEMAEGRADTRMWRQRMNAARAHREAHFARLIRLIELHNVLASHAGRVRARRSGPTSSVLGLELPPDHDLRAPAHVDPAWWSEAPEPGALAVVRR